MRALISSSCLVVVAAVATLACPAVAGAQVESRVALVIGNSTYREVPLRNPVNDARAMAKTCLLYTSDAADD